MSVAPTPDALRAPDVEVTASPEPVANATDADLVVVDVRRTGDDLVAGRGLGELGPEASAWLGHVLRTQRFRAEAGELLQVPWPGDLERRQTLLLMGLGDRSAHAMRRAGAAVGRCARGHGHVAVAWEGLDETSAQAFVEGVVLGGFSYRLRSTAEGRSPVGRITLWGATIDPEVLRRGVLVARAGWYSRALALTPSNIKSPTWLVQQAVDVAEQWDLEVEVRSGDALRDTGFGGLLGVGQASEHEPALVRLGYAPAGASRRAPHVVLVGKGITFDTGGLSIKPGEAMANMKRDMTGAGVVLAVMDALAQLGCPWRVTGLLAIAENSVGGDALRPGDVIRHYGGRTTEVTNTDAEGRLVLADAMAFAVDKLSPTVLVDVATLTGAVRVALGQRIGGLFTDDDELADELSQAARTSGEPLWRLPLVDDYEDRIASKVADADNAGGSPGAITAALFLRHFAGDVRWAHLDLASVGDSPDDSFEWTQGATGFGARLLLHWLCLSQRSGTPGADPSR
jgi:leucyl aminopeptidase